MNLDGSYATEIVWPLWNLVRKLANFDTRMLNGSCGTDSMILRAVMILVYESLLSCSYESDVRQLMNWRTGLHILLNKSGKLNFFGVIESYWHTRIRFFLPVWLHQWSYWRVMGPSDCVRCRMPWDQLVFPADHCQYITVFKRHF